MATRFLASTFRAGFAHAKRVTNVIASVLPAKFGNNFPSLAKFGLCVSMASVGLYVSLPPVFSDKKISRSIALNYYEEIVKGNYISSLLLECRIS